MALTDLKKHQYLIFLDTKKDLAMTQNTWKRIDKSTIFELSANEESESFDYIAYESPVEEVMKNSPEMSQEIKLEEGNPIYDFMFEELYNLPTGEACKVPFLLCFGGTGKKAWRGISTVVDKVLNTVDGKLTFTLKMGGNIERGTYSVSDGVPTFTEGGAGV